MGGDNDEEERTREQERGTLVNNMIDSRPEPMGRVCNLVEKKRKQLRNFINPRPVDHGSKMIVCTGNSSHNPIKRSSCARDVAHMHTESSNGTRSASVLRM